MFERAPGYFLGSTYLNYGFTAMTLTPLYMYLHFGLGWSNQVLTVPLLLYCTIVPLVVFRYARAWWLAMDCMLDTTHFQEAADLASVSSSASETRSGEALPPTRER